MEELLKNPHVWWIDNFNKAYGQMFYKLGTGPIKVLNWTGWAYHELPAEAADLLTILSTHPLFPQFLQTYSSSELLSSWLNEVVGDKGVLPFFLDQSFCVRNHIYNVPLKPYLPGPDISHQDVKRLEQHLDGLANFVPVKLLQHNVGSDVGLANVLAVLSRTYKFGASAKYSICKVDVNIFWRLYRVMLIIHIILESIDVFLFV